MACLECFINLEVVHKMNVILREVWGRDDMCAARGQFPRDGTPGSLHWLDVMVEKKVEFLF